MKYYSEKLNQLFDSQEELELAEGKKAATKKVSVNEKVAKKTAAETAPTKKQLASEIELAEDALREAYSNYDAAKVKAEEVCKKFLEEINSILDPAKKAVKDAEKNRYEAIRKFNDSYGTYQVTYTGARAANDMINAINNINLSTHNIFRDIFWI